MSEKKGSIRGGFSGKVGFILAGAGAAVGLGNIWRFPYLVASGGGGIFLLVYLILALTFGISLMCAEIAIGRKTGVSAPLAYGMLDRRFSFLGYLATLAPVLIFPYYCVIGGWVLKYTTVYIIGEGGIAAADGYFSAFTSSAGESILFFLIFLIVSSLLVALGVRGGIERVTKIMMPLLLAIVVFITVFILASSDTATEALSFYFLPDLTRLTPMTFVNATGQIFYSMSVAMGTMITFGSYMSRDISIKSSARAIVWFDIAVAFLSGLMVVGATYAKTGGDPTALEQGASLLFSTLPAVFGGASFGNILGSVFFIMVLFAALTSAVALLETVVSAVVDKTGIHRIHALSLVTVFSIVLALPSALGYNVLSGVRILGFGILDFFDFATNNLLMPLVAIISCIFIGYVIKPRTVINEMHISGKPPSSRSFSFIIRYAAPFGLAVIFISSVLSIL